jgi:SAM-dependent methyltransferase
VLGADISEPLLLRARERASSSELPKDALTLVNADAAAHHFDEQAFDLVFSRFGVMFFADPVHAFKNIARGIKRSGRLVFMCWRPLVLNEWMSVPFGAVRHLLPATEPTPEGAPGPFAFADQNRVRGILTGAGFRDVTFEAADRPMGLGSTVPEAADYALTIGMLARAVREANDPSLKAKVREHLVTLFEKTATDAGVEMPAAVWLVSARPS